MERPDLKVERVTVQSVYKNLQGRSLALDIDATDSTGRRFYALVDGSYLLVRDGTETLCGEAYRIADGKCAQISAEGETVAL